MTCAYCGLKDAAADAEYCPECQQLMQEAAHLLFAGLAELFRAAREQQEAERNAA